MKERTRDTLGMCIRIARIKAGLKMSDLAKGAGVSNTTVFKWEHDVSVPSIEHAIGICRTCGQSLDGVFYPLYKL